MTPSTRRHSPSGLLLRVHLALLLAAGLFACGSPSAPACAPLSEPLAASPFPYACPEEVGLVGAGLTGVLDQVRGFVEDGSIVGGELMLVKDGRIVLHEAVGWNDQPRGLRLERNSIYRIRSMTKPVVGTAVLMLVDEGRVDLEDHVRDYLPSFDNERSGDITIRQLLTHTAGYVQGGWPGRFSEFASLQDAVNAVGEAGPHQPSGAFVYSDLSTATLGAIVEVVSGTLLDRFIEERILGPLGMRDTYTRFAPGASWAPRMNATYRSNGGSWEQYWNPTMDQVFPFFRAAGGLYSTVFDYALFLEAWTRLGDGRGVRLLSSQLARRALVDAVRDAYAYQWAIWSGPGTGTGLPTFGHTGFNGTLGGASPETGAMVLYFTQSTRTHTLGPIAVAAFEALAR